jgi:tetratricopeptide (TPR) repeat protein
MRHNHQVVRAAALAAVLTLAGCSTFNAGSGPTSPPPPPAPTTTTPPPVTPPQPPARPPEPSTSSAWQPLVSKAKQAAGRGDYEQALALLERAQRIEPRAGAIYLELARVHRARGDAEQARSTAERGLLYCRGNTECDALRALLR